MLHCWFTFCFKLCVAKEQVWGMNYSHRPCRNIVNIQRNIQWEVSLGANMEEHSDQDMDGDKNRDSNEPKSQRKFYNGQETVSFQNECEEQLAASGTFRSLSDQRNRVWRDRERSNRGYRGRGQRNRFQRSMSTQQRGQRYPSYRSRRKNSEQSKGEKESESNNLSSLNYSFSTGSSNFDNGSEKLGKSFQKDLDYEFLPNSVNVKRQKGHLDSINKDNDYSENSDTESEDANDNSPGSILDQFRKTQEKLLKIKKTLQPSEIIMGVRKEIEKKSNDCTEKHLQKIDMISSIMEREKAYEPIFKLHYQNLQLQQKEFDAFVTSAKHKFNFIQHGSAEVIVNTADNIKLQIENECCLFQRTFPAYAYKSDILSALNENQVVIVSADCSYFFNIVTPAIIQSGLPHHSIVSCESNGMTSEYVKDKFKNIIKIGAETSSKIHYLTEDKMLNLLSDGAFSEKFVAIVNLPLKRSISVDLSLAFLRELLLKQKDTNLILLLSAFDNVEKYQKYFSTLKTFLLKVPELLLPSKTMWIKEPSKNYKEDIVCTALSIHILNESGNILAFLPNLAEAKTAVSMFSTKIRELNDKNIECVLLHETSSISHLIHPSNPDKRTVFVASDCAEVIPIPSVRYVIDCGKKRDYIFDKQKNLDVLTTIFTSRAKARLRKSLVCVYKPGICYRTYSKENFCRNMSSFERPDILTCNPFNTLIKVFQYAPENALTMEFVEPLNNAVKYNNIKLLKNFNAVKDGKLTHLGKKMVKLPLPARYSKLIFQGIDWGYPYEAVILAAYFSVDLFLFKYSKDEEAQRDIDAAKLNLIQYESDALSFLSIYKAWMQNRCSTFWCDKFYINSDTLDEVKKKVSEICQYAYEYAGENIHQEFNENEEDLASDLPRILLHSFGDQFCVFSGHYRGGYRILSSSQTAFLHPSTMICNKDNLPQFIVFNKMICSTRNFLVGITAIPPDLVQNSLTDSCDKILDYDYSDIFERSLVRKTIEPVGERIIKQILLGKKGGKLVEIEDFIKKELNTESIVIEPLVEKGSVHVYALETFADSALKMVDQILKSNVDDIINAEQVHTLKFKKGEVTVPIEVKCVMGAKITFVKVKDNLHDAGSIESSLNTKKKNVGKENSSSVKYSLNLTWIRRPCNGICYLDFSEKHFKVARKLATKNFLVMGTEVYVEVSKKADNQLLCTDVPPEARARDVEKDLKRFLPGIEVAKIEMKFKPSFESTPTDLARIKMEIQEICEEFTNLSEYDIIVPKPKDTATIMTVYINVYCTEDLTKAAEKLSNVLINDNFKLDTKPVYRSVINTSYKIFTALESRLVEELGTLKVKLGEIYPNKDLFCFQADNFGQDLVYLKLLTNDIQIMKNLQRSVNELLEGEVLNKNTVKDIHKLFCHGGHMWLRTLERSKRVVILEEYNSKIIRVYGSQENCFKVKKCILNFLEDTENEAVETITLNDDKNNRILLRSIIKKFGVNLEPFVEACGLLTAVLDIKSNRLLLHGSRESIDKAKEILDEFSSSLDSTEDCSLLSGGEMCPVCASPAFNLTFRLQHCGHLYCSECLLGLVTQAKFPMQCCAENCSEDIVLDDIVRILDEDDEKFKKLLHASLDVYLEQNRADIVFCPAPDCSMFFFKTDVSGRWNCPLCQNEICINCNVVYHHGYTCDMFQGSRKDPDYSYKAWRQNTMQCKDCPKCKIPIEKNEGCDHMTCVLCNAHFCWVCVREFRTDKEVYNHIPFCDMYPKW